MSSPPQPETGVLIVAGPIAHGDVYALCECLRVLLEASDAEVIVCDVRALAADAVTVDALARLQLTACRLGRRICLHRSSPELDQLLSFVGLSDVLAADPRGLGLGLRRQTEEREQPRRVQERVDRDDACP